MDAIIKTNQKEIEEMNYILRKKRQLQESAWLLGICENGFDDLKENRIHWIRNGIYEGKKWFADPFILDYDEKIIHLLVEEFDYKVHRGRIAKLTVDREKWVVEDCKIILDLDTHLSFPMIWEENNHVFICPENYASGALNLYEYDKENESLTYLKPLIKGELTDAIIYKDETDYYVFSTFVPTPNGKKLTIYHSKNFNGVYEQVQEVNFSENIARNAGKMFMYQKHLIRPSQECNHTYGHAISFQQVQRNEDGFSFQEEFRYFSTHPSYYKYGTHTYNQHLDGMAVIDVKGFRYTILGKWMWKLQRMMIRLKLKREIWLK